ncbi:MAG: GAF domain-containing sensor histidine kinase [bacterium]|nr:MAG: GAF domain-containing sensor histidine kinase [bacterium]
MTPETIVLLLKRVRTGVPAGVRPALLQIDSVFRDLLGIAASALIIPAQQTVYLTRVPGGTTRSAVARKLDHHGESDFRLVLLELDPGGSDADHPSAPYSTMRIPIFSGRRQFGVLVLIKEGEEAFDNCCSDALPILTEVLSSLLHPFAERSRIRAGPGGGDALKLELLEAVGNENLMRSVLLHIMELTQSEFCAFLSAGVESDFYILLEGRELSPHIAHIRDKLGTVFGMFANKAAEPGLLNETVYLRRRERNLAYLLGDARIESYFLVPVTFGAKVRGLLYVGSIRKDAFGREDIGAFRGFAEEGSDKAPLLFRMGGETEIIESMIDAVPYGGALVSPEGTIRHANEPFRELLQIQSVLPETIQEMDRVSFFHLQGVWEEFKIIHRNLIERELHSVGVPERVIAVTWIMLDRLAADAGSLVLVKDITDEKDRQRAREEMLATVAHELRTPMTALRNSLEILLGEDISAPKGIVKSQGADTGVQRARFLRTALRTLQRLGMLVDSLIDVSSRASDDKPLRLEHVDVRSFLEDASVLFVESMVKRGIEFDIDVGSGVSDLVFDRDRMEQVIQNLLSNSLKNVVAEQKISISVSRCDAVPQKSFPLLPWKHLDPPAIADICVRDTGSGIPQEVMEMMNHSGTGDGMRPAHGLGLYISRRLIQRQGGSLVIERGMGGGSSVHLHMPADLETVRVVQTARIIEGNLSGMIARGMTPVLYTALKRTERCWPEIVETWRIQPMMNPGAGEIDDAGFYVWPLGERCAIALSTDMELIRDPMSLLQNGRVRLQPQGEGAFDGIRLGWAIGPQDGESYAELMSVSLERLGVISGSTVEERRIT